MLKVIKSPPFATAMAAAGCEPLGSTSAEMAALIAAETTKFARIVKEGNIVVE